MASEGAGAARAPERRLHPFSWLFVLLTQLRQVIVPLLVLLVLGRGEWWELAAVVGAAGLALYSLVYSFGFRYRLEADELVVREGIIDRTERHIPYARVQNIVQKRNPLHRMFGVSELRLESAGGLKPEAVMSVIPLADALRIERILREHAAPQVGGDDPVAVEPAAAASPILLRLPLPELLRLGLVTNRGWVVVGAGMALLWQVVPEERGVARSAWRLVEPWIGIGAEYIPGPLAWAASAALFLLMVLLAVKALSLLMAVVDFHGFVLERRGERVRTEAGLLTRRVASARRDKVQRLLFADGWLMRRMGRQALSCEVAGGLIAANEDAGARLRWLAPIAPPAEIERIADDVAEGLLPSRMDWQPLHPQAWRRMFNAAAFWWTVVAVPPLVAFGPWVLAGWALLLGWTFIEARAAARFGAWAFDGEVFAVRGGWLTRRWTLARIGRGQSVSLASTPLDRRAGMASVSMDTAGVRPGSFELRVDYLDADRARELHASLAARLDPVRATGWEPREAA
ncbi:MAG: PH domain-containing protein [Xanthomonadaceae bacterium]|jgi:putative membrane protein|nr:PH domain-containing protein [Xanthomonadaceae bacterium]